jgi:hypothetical protein
VRCAHCRDCDCDHTIVIAVLISRVLPGEHAWRRARQVARAVHRCVVAVAYVCTAYACAYTEILSSTGGHLLLRASSPTARDALWRVMIETTADVLSVSRA